MLRLLRVENVEIVEGDNLGFELPPSTISTFSTINILNFSTIINRIIRST